MDDSSTLPFGSDEVLGSSLFVINNPINCLLDIIKDSLSWVQWAVFLSFEISCPDKNGIPAIFICSANI